MAGWSRLRGNVFLLAGVVLLAAGGVTALDRSAFVRHASVADGVVAALNAGGSHPQIAFKTASGREVSYPQGGWIFGYAVGQRVRVLYDADAPGQSAVIDDFGALWGTPIFLGLLGAVFTVGGLCVAMQRRMPVTD